MYACKSGKHHWFHKDDADKCCNGYTRILVFGGGDKSQIIEGIRLGRGWLKSPPAHAASPVIEP